MELPPHIISPDLVNYYFNQYETIVISKVQKQAIKPGIRVDDISLSQMRQALGKAFWKDVSSEINNDEIVDKLRQKVKCRRQEELRSTLCRMGFRRNGSVHSYDRCYSVDPIMTDQEDVPEGHKNINRVDVAKHRHLCHFVPFLTIGKSSEEAASRLLNLNDALVAHFGKGNTKTKKREHEGWSLAYTATSGGIYGNIQKGISGSIHWNKHFKKNDDLQREVLQAVAEMVISAFGEKAWYKKLMLYFDQEENQYMKDRLIPGTPCTSIWWNTEIHPFRKHHDWNAFGPAFLFCPKTYKGGETIVTNPTCDVSQTIHLTWRDVVAGRWSRCKHYNKPSVAGERCSFVVYFDTRLANPAYEER